MGQANARGTRNDRVAAAIQRNREFDLAMRARSAQRLAAYTSNKSRDWHYARIHDHHKTIATLPHPH